jgi:hypothetical protein
MAGAPIGNQNARKWDKQTDSPEFKAWFGDSKVVDKDGKPLVVYHKTNADFSEFKPSFFSTEQIGDDYGDRVYPVYLKIENPAGDKEIKESVEKLGLPAKDLNGDKMKPFEYLNAGLVGSPLSEEDVRDLRNHLQDRGFDGAHVKDVDVKKSWFAFHPTQIKSAIGNRGTWSKTDPRITARAAIFAATFTSDIPGVIEELQNEGRLPSTLTRGTMDAIEKSLQRYAVKISQMKLQQACDMVKDIAEQALKTEQGVGAAGGTVTTGLNPASSRGVLDAFLEGAELTRIGETMDMGFFLRTAMEVAEGAGNFMAQNFDQTRIDEFPALELLRVYDRMVPRGSPKDPEGPDNAWDGGRWPAACDEAGDDDALKVFTETGRMVALKSSGVWQALGDGAGGYTDTLGNAFEPFAFNSGVGTDEVSRDEAVELGLMHDDDEVEPAKIDFKDLLNFEATGKLAASLAHRALMAGAPIGNQNARKDHVAQTETKEFKAWFGDSKVVDKDGKPLVVYHGENTGAKRNDSGGIFFTDNKDIAKGYGDEVNHAYLKMESPAEFDFEGRSRVSFNGKEGLSPSQLTKEIESIRSDIKNNYSMSDELRGELKEHGFDDLVDKNIDGIVMHNVNDSMEFLSGKTATHYVAFHPTQIKSAIGNKGTWSKTDPRITARAAREAASLLALEARFTAKGFTIEAGEAMPDAMAVCPSCKALVNLSKEPEICMGAVVCPKCKHPVTQEHLSEPISRE